jgi:hypothetical protein
MIFTIEGKEYDIPESELTETEIAGVALVGNGYVSEGDIAIADQEASSELQMMPVSKKTKIMQLRLLRSSKKNAVTSLDCAEKVVVRSSRLYFELSDSTVTLSPPLGQSASHIETHWMFTWIPRAFLQQIKSEGEIDKNDEKSSRLCVIDGKLISIPAERISKRTTIFTIKVSGKQVTEQDIELLDTYVADSFDEDIARYSTSVEIQRMRLYFQLPDGTITMKSPVGRTDSRINCCSMLQTISKEELKELSI